MMSSSAEEIRLHVDKKYVRPARERGVSSVRVPAREVADDLGYKARFPAICTALKSRKFESEFRVRLAGTEGPEQSSTTVFTFTVLP